MVNTKPRVTSSSSSPSHSVRINTHKDKGGVQVFVVFPLEIPVMLFHFSLKFVVELHPGIDASSSVA